jgi:hypothetical protein
MQARTSKPCLDISLSEGSKEGLFEGCNEVRVATKQTHPIRLDWLIAKINPIHSSLINKQSNLYSLRLVGLVGWIGWWGSGVVVVYVVVVVNEIIHFTKITSDSYHQNRLPTTYNSFMLP